MLADGRAIFKGNPQRLIAYKSGDGGLLQMRDAFDEKDVCFALLRVPIGSGKGEKCKHCFILFTGSGVGSVRIFACLKFVSRIIIS